MPPQQLQYGTAAGQVWSILLTSCGPDTVSAGFARPGRSLLVQAVVSLDAEPDVCSGSQLPFKEMRSLRVYGGFPGDNLAYELLRETASAGEFGMGDVFHFEMFLQDPSGRHGIVGAERIG